MGELIQIVIPTYRRLDKLQDTYDQLHELAGTELLFVAHESDDASQALLHNLGVNYVIDTQEPSGVNATNKGYWAVTSDWFVIGQDDFKWHEGWLDAAKEARDVTGAKVIGLNDGYVGRDEHSVGWFIERQFVQDYSLSPSFPNVIFYPHYKKNYSDNELNDVAKYRGVWAYAHDALCEHLHPSFGKGKTDQTYEVLDAKLAEDTALYHSRRHLWTF